jgi:kumamolisin
LANKYGSSPADLVAVNNFAKENNLATVSAEPLTGTVRLSGRIEDLEKAFGTKLRHVQVEGKTVRERSGPLTVPQELNGVVEGVFGLDNREAAQPRFRPAAATANSFSPIQVANLYQFPAGTGAGQTVAIIELGGGFVQSDLTTYFNSLGIGNGPTVTAVSVDGATNSPAGNPNSADGEVMLDIEVVGALVPQAAIKVYFAANTDKGFLDAITEAVHDPATTVVSISWGGPESNWTGQAMKAFDKAFQNAAALKVPVTVASGDNGSTDGTKTLNVDFPASSPHALACGGTRLEGSTTITSEVVWNSNGGGTGGGVSSQFAKPSYQSGANVPAPPTSTGGRGVPDVAGDADPDTGYNVRVDGQDFPIGGTSAVAPLWAALIARIAGNSGQKVPFLNPVLYANPTAFNDITSGNNDVGGGGGKYQAGPGWDPCTGLGSPIGGQVQNAVNAASGRELVTN